MNLKLVSLDSLSVKVDYGFTASAVKNTDGPKFLRITDLQNDSVNWDSVPSYDSDNKDVSKYLLNTGDIVFARTGATTGKSYLLTELPDGSIFASYLIRVRPNEKVAPSYLSYFFKSTKYWQQINFMANGAAQPGVNSTKLRELIVPLASLPEQKQIAKILDAADSLRQKDQQLIDHYNTLSQSLFLDMFGDPVTNPKAWGVKNLKELSIKIHSGNTPKGGSKVYVDKGVTFFRSQNVWKNRLELDDVVYIDKETHSKMSKSSLKNQDILMTKTGRINTENSSLGRAAIFLGEDDTANVNGHVYLIRLQDYVINEFVLFILTSIEYRDYIRSVCVGGIDKRQLNKGHLENFPIISPPRDLQDQFVEKLKLIERQKKQTQAALKKSEDLFNSLLQMAFKGERTS